MMHEPSSENGSLRRKFTWMEMFPSTKLGLLRRGSEKFKEYYNVFSLVAMLMLVRIMLALATYFNLEIWQMNANMDCLNVNFQGRVYDPSRGFSLPG
jgi:hypothetical protein